MQNGYGGIDTLPAFPVLYRSFFHFSEQTPVLLDAELGFVDTLNPGFHIEIRDNFGAGIHNEFGFIGRNAQNYKISTKALLAGEPILASFRSCTSRQGYIFR